MSDTKPADGAQSPEQPANGTASPETTQLQEQLDKLKNEHLYLRADFENYKKHVAKERAELIKFGAERFIRDFLTVLDNFDRALAVPVSPENYDSFRQGIELTATEMRNLLAKHGIQEVPSEGQAFDPSFQEALSSEPSETVEPGHVVRVFQKAYKFHDKLLRPAQVIVAKAP